MKNKDGTVFGDVSTFPWIKYDDGIDKEQATREIVNLSLDRASQMLKINNLPETMPERGIKRLLMTAGYMVTPDPKIPKNEKLQGKLYGFIGGIGGVHDVYYDPTLFTVACPFLKYDAQLDVTNDKEAVLIRFDTMGEGLSGMLSRYASRIVDASVTLRHQIIQSRIFFGIIAPNDTAKKSAEQFIRDVYEGKKLGVMADSAFLEGIKALDLPTSQANAITQTIESIQYLKAGMCNELGLQSNYNMKREAVNSVEAQLDTDALLPLPANILENVSEGFERFNRKFGTNVTVELSGAWLERQANEPKEGEGVETD